VAFLFSGPNSSTCPFVDRALYLRNIRHFLSSRGCNLDGFVVRDKIHDLFFGASRRTLSRRKRVSGCTGSSQRRATSSSKASQARGSYDSRPRQRSDYWLIPPISRSSFSSLTFLLYWRRPRGRGVSAKCVRIWGSRLGFTARPPARQ
jgi:hypothetical protein